MVINKLTGKIEFDSRLILSPDFKKGDLKTIADKFDVKPLISNAGWESFGVGPFENRDGLFGLVVYFFGDSIEKIHLCYIFPDEKGSWDEWSYDLETERRKIHERFLVSMLGNDKYYGSWGSVESLYDEKGSRSFICVTYRREQSE